MQLTKLQNTCTDVYYLVIHFRTLANSYDYLCSEAKACMSVNVNFRIK